MCSVPALQARMRGRKRAKAASGKVEDLLEALQSGVRALVSGKLEERSHLGLPAGVHLALFHCLNRRLEVVAVQISDQQAVVAEKERVVAPACLPESVERLRPNLAMARPVLVEAVGAHAQ